MESTTPSSLGQKRVLEETSSDTQSIKSEPEGPPTKLLRISESEKLPPLYFLAQPDMSELVTFEVSWRKKTFVIGKVYLISHSEYFRTALTGPWKEAEDKLIRLHDIEIGPFRLFAGWLLSHTLPITDDDWIYQAGAQAYAFRFDTISSIILKLYHISDRFIVPDLQHELKGILMKRYSLRFVPIGMIDYAFTHLPTFDPLQKYFVTNWCIYWRPGHGHMEHDSLQRLPSSFFVAYIKDMGLYAQMGEYHWRALPKPRQKVLERRISVNDGQNEDAAQTHLVKMVGDGYQYVEKQLDKEVQRLTKIAEGNPDSWAYNIQADLMQARDETRHRIEDWKDNFDAKSQDA